jgi:hypothetical protein
MWHNLTLIKQMFKFFEIQIVVICQTIILCLVLFLGYSFLYMSSRTSIKEVYKVVDSILREKYMYDFLE